MKNHKCKSASAFPIFEMFESLLNYGLNAIRILQIQGDTSDAQNRTKNEFLFLLGNIPQFSFMIVNFNTLVFRYTTFSLWILSLICIVIFASKTYSFSCLVGEKTGFSHHVNLILREKYCGDLLTTGVGWGNRRRAGRIRPEESSDLALLRCPSSNIIDTS